jgi:hypothetical protein
MKSRLRAPGSLHNGVLSLEVVRSDIGEVELRGVRVSAAFALSGHLAFQPAGPKRAVFNGDLPVRPEELAAVKEKVLEVGFDLQAVYQRSHDLASSGLHANGHTLSPPVWFVHWSGSGEPVAMTEAVREVLESVSVALPQVRRPPADGGRDAEQLRRILRGYHASSGADGVITVLVRRRQGVDLGGVVLRPETNLATKVFFQRLDRGAAVAADFAMAAGEVNGVMKVMRAQGWQLGGLYNRQTGERPRLFYSYHFRTGGPRELASEIRRGLDETDSA